MIKKDVNEFPNFSSLGRLSYNNLRPNLLIYDLDYTRTISEDAFFFQTDWKRS